MRASLVLLALLTGCASMSEDQCRTANWEDVGYRDGLQGHSASRLTAYREDCGKIGIRPDEGRWRIGHLRAIPIYCSPENGLRAGASGWSYSGICPPEVEAAFLNRYRAGREIYETRQRLSRLDSEINSLDQQLRRRELPDAQRRDLDRRRNQLSFERSMLRSQLTGMEMMIR